jgi:hypothetical protein
VNVACKGENEKCIQGLVEKELLGRPSRRWENIKMALTRIKWDGMGYKHLA